MTVFKLAVRLAVSASILALVFQRIDVAQVVAVLREADARLLLGAVLLQLASSSLAAYRWFLLMRNLAFGQTLASYWRSYFKSLFFNQGLPTSIGGDAVRVLDVARRGFRKRDAAYAVMIDRGLGLAALLVLNLFAHAFAPALLPPEILYVTVLAAGLAILGFTGAWHLADLRNPHGHPQLARAKRLSLRLHTAFASRRVAILGASLAIHVLAMLSVYAIGSGLDLQQRLITYFIVVPPAILLTVVPVSIAGWGVREGALAALFSLLGADTATVVAMSIVYGVTLIAVSLPGLLIYMRERHSVV